MMDPEVNQFPLRKIAPHDEGAADSPRLRQPCSVAHLVALRELKCTRPCLQWLNSPKRGLSLAALLHRQANAGPCAKTQNRAAWRAAHESLGTAPCTIQRLAPQHSLFRGARSYCFRGRKESNVRIRSAALFLPLLVVGAAIAPLQSQAQVSTPISVAFLQGLVN